MASGANGEPAYRLAFPEVVAHRVRQLHAQALGQGRATEFRLAFRQILDHLRRAPLEFGEPLYYLPAMRLQVRLGIVRPLLIDFAVSEEQRIVYVKSVKLLSQRHR